MYVRLSCQHYLFIYFILNQGTYKKRLLVLYFYATLDTYGSVECD